MAKYADESHHEVASHCYKVLSTLYLIGASSDLFPAVQWIPYAGMSAEEEESYIRKAADSFKMTSNGKVPVGTFTSSLAGSTSDGSTAGWFYGRPSARSAPLVAKV